MKLPIILALVVGLLAGCATKPVPAPPSTAQVKHAEVQVRSTARVDRIIANTTSTDTTLKGLRERLVKAQAINDQIIKESTQ